MKETLSSKIYKNEFVENFPGDTTGDKTPRPTPKVLYSTVMPTQVSKPTLLAWSDALADELGVERPENSLDVGILAGNSVAESMRPYAACYAGHQFGNWAGQLGDGRAITLGEWPLAKGGSMELQLKGAGPTPYSRRADGRAVLRSSLREYLMSEAMYYLGVPTTRALSLVSTGDSVLRDMFYNGNPAYEPGAIVMRVAPSFLRFGNYEMLAARDEIGNLKKLVDWTIDRYYPHIKGEDRVIVWFEQVLHRTATLMAEWLRVGFVHGVMNTDNMSILGLTIDYGPFSFLDDYDPEFTPNTTDLPGKRYAFGKQPSVGYWNLIRLANAIAPLLEDKDQLVKVLETYQEVYLDKYYQMMSRKLGLDQVLSEDIDLISDFDDILSELGADMTIFYQLLIELPLEPTDQQSVVGYFQESFYKKELSVQQEELLYKLILAYIERISQNTMSREASQELMRAHNPRFILRNYLLHQAIEALEGGEDQLFLRLQDAIKNPYAKDADEFFVKRPIWATKRAGCSMLSCSS